MADPNFLKKSESDKEQKNGASLKKEEKRRKENSAEVRSVNLISKEVERRVSSQAFRGNALQIGLAAVGGLLLGVLLYGGVRVYGFFELQKLASVRASLEETERTIAGIENSGPALVDFQTQLGAIRALLDKHLYWNSFLIELEKTTLPEVSYHSLSVALDSDITLSATAPSYGAVAKQLIAFQQASHFISSVQISSANALLSQTGDSIGVNFIITFRIKPEILNKRYGT